MSMQNGDKPGSCEHQGCQDASSWRCKVLHSSKEIVPLVESLLQELQSTGYSQKDIFGVRLAIEEALVNAIKHGHRHDPCKAAHFRYQLTPTSILIEVQDEGPGFRPEDVPDPLAAESWERPSGRGLLLMRAYMSWVRFNDRGNCVTLCKHRAC